MNSELHTFLRSRRSIRHFKPERVSEAILRQILETATFAPSAHNKQPWRFIVLTNSEIKLKLAYAITKKFRFDMTADGVVETDIQTRIDRTIRRTDEAPVIVVLCRDMSQITAQPDESRQQAEITMDIQSVAVAGLQLLLAAHAEGLGGTWICWPLFAREETRLVLDLPLEWEPQGMVFLGIPDEEPALPEKRPFTEVVHFLS